MNQKEAKDLNIKVWKWLAKHPDCTKWNSPYWKDLKDLKGNCPLCEYLKLQCVLCPLHISENKGYRVHCDSPLSNYYKWNHGSYIPRIWNAWRIVRKTKKWKINEE